MQNCFRLPRAAPALCMRYTPHIVFAYMYFLRMKRFLFYLCKITRTGRIFSYIRQSSFWGLIFFRKAGIVDLLGEASSKTLLRAAVPLHIMARQTDKKG